MRNRLKEITGLDPQQVEQLAQSARPAACRTTTLATTTTPWPATPGLRRHAASPTTPRQAGAGLEPNKGKKQWDDKPWDKNGKPWQRDGQRAPPRVPAPVEPPHCALRTLLHHPLLAGKVEDASHFADEAALYSQLLVALIEAAQKNPKLSSMQLIARWHGTEQGRLLRALAEKEWLIVPTTLNNSFSTL
jgi:DNA primase